MSDHDLAIKQAVARWSEDRRDDWEERAAMYEYAAGHDREDAERRAYYELRRPLKDKGRKAA